MERARDGLKLRYLTLKVRGDSAELPSRSLGVFASGTRCK